MKTANFVLLLSLFLVSSQLSGQFGILDPSFGIGGISLLQPVQKLVISTAVTSQDDGKITVAGTVTNNSSINKSDILILRLDAQGKLDSTFNNNGILIKDISGEDDRLQAIRIQPDGKILVAGSSEIAITYRLLLMRFNPDGSPDYTFNNSGIATYFEPANTSRAYSIELQNDGKIIVAGYHDSGAINSDAIILRYNSDGTPDVQFGENGIVKIDLTKKTQANGVICMPNGKIIVSGGISANGGYYPMLLKLNEDGTRVQSFGVEGMVVVESDTAGSAAFFDIDIQDNSKIILTAGYIDKYKLLRLDALTGQLDESFGTNGKVNVDLGQHCIQSGLKVQADGKIVTSGHLNSNSNDDILLFRFEPDGNPDTTFGVDGMVATDVGMNTDDGSYGLYIQKDGKIILSGYSREGANFSIPVLRFLSGLIVTTDEKSQKQLSPNLFPNPSASVISFEYNLDAPQETSLLIYDEKGSLIKVIHSLVQKGPGSIDEQVRIDDLPSGVYFIHLKTQKSGQVIKKFIKN